MSSKNLIGHLKLHTFTLKKKRKICTTCRIQHDNFESVIEYLNEAKTYTAKVREYKDGKRPKEYISDQMLSDFDVSTFADSDIGEVRTLDFSMSPTETLCYKLEYTKAYGSYDINRSSGLLENVCEDR